MNAVYYKKALNYYLGELERRRLEGNQKLVNHYLDEINALQERYQYKNAK
jgi:hypothetical protein